MTRSTSGPTTVAAIVGLVSAALWWPNDAVAAVLVWDNDAGDNQWFNGANWDPDDFPDPSDELTVSAGFARTGMDVYIAAGGSITVDGADASVLFGNLFIGDSQSGTLSIRNQGSVEVDRCIAVASQGTIAVGPGDAGLSDPLVNDGTVSVQQGNRLTLSGEVSGAGNYTGAGAVAFLDRFSPGNNTALVTFEGDVQFGESSTYDVEIAEWDSPGGLPPQPPLPDPPMDPTINDRVHATAGDVYLDGELRLTATAKLHPMVPSPYPPHAQVGWYGHQTRIIASTEGQDQVRGVFATVPDPQPEHWDDLLTGTEEWYQGHVGSGVFLTRQNDGGPNDVPGISYTAGATKLHLFQACDGDTNGDGRLGGRDIQNIQFYWPYDPWGQDPGPPFFWPPVWPHGDFNGDGLLNGWDIQAILATGLWPSTYAAVEPGTPLDGVVDLLLYPEDVTLDDGTVVPAGALMIDPGGLTINGYVIRSEGGIFTGEPAENLGWFAEDNDFTINGNMGFTLTGRQVLGPVIGPESAGMAAEFYQDDLTFTYTIEGSPGVFAGTLIVVPEPGGLSILAGGMAGLLVLLLIRDRRVRRRVGRRPADNPRGKATGA